MIDNWDFINENKYDADILMEGTFPKAVSYLIAITSLAANQIAHYEIEWSKDTLIDYIAAFRLSEKYESRVRGSEIDLEVAKASNFFEEVAVKLEHYASLQKIIDAWKSFRGRSGKVKEFPKDNWILPFQHYYECLDIPDLPPKKHDRRDDYKQGYYFITKHNNNVIRGVEEKEEMIDNRPARLSGLFK